MKEFFLFNEMITPRIITFIYWLLLVVALFSGLSMMFGGMGGMTFGSFISGLLTIAGGALGARIWSELLIVLFKINDNLRRMADHQANS